MGAWVESAGDVAILHPSLDALQLRDSFSSIVVYTLVNPRFARFFSEMPLAGPKYVRVAGVIHWIRVGRADSHADPTDANRAGVLQDVNVTL